MTTESGTSADKRRWPSVAIVVPTRDRHELLLGSLESIRAGDLLPDEIIIVDQSQQPIDLSGVPTGGTRLRYVWSGQRGVSRGRNAGIRATKCEVIAFIDDDILVDPGWLRALVGGLLDAGRRRVVTGDVVAGEPERVGGFAPSVKARQRRITYRGRPAEDSLSGCNMATRREAFIDVGLFDVRLGPGSRYPSSEDNDLCFRLLEAGYEIEYIPEIRVRHRAWREPAALGPLAWAYGVGQGAYWAKHVSLRDGYMLRRAGDDVVQHAWRALVTARRRPGRAAADAVYVAGVLVGAAWWLVRERRPRRPQRAAAAEPRSSRERPVELDRRPRGPLP